MAIWMEARLSPIRATRQQVRLSIDSRRCATIVPGIFSPAALYFLFYHVFWPPLLQQQLVPTVCSLPLHKQQGSEQQQLAYRHLL